MLRFLLNASALLVFFNLNSGSGFLMSPYHASGLSKTSVSRRSFFPSGESKGLERRRLQDGDSVSRDATRSGRSADDDDNHYGTDNLDSSSEMGAVSLAERRNVLNSILSSSMALVLSTVSVSQPANAEAVRAVGSAEIECRKRGDCLETGEWDGAVGWNWGAKDRCDATDPLCGPNGQLLDEIPGGQDVPALDGRAITHVVQINLRIGRGEEARGSLKMGLYGNDFPLLTEQFVDYCDGRKGIVTSRNLISDDGYGISAAPVRFDVGGALTNISPGERVEFGVPSQSIAYAKSRGRAKAGNDFVAQPRPNKSSFVQSGDGDAQGSRGHTIAGLVSVPSGGIGNGGTGFESDDEAYASSFQLTATSVPAMDKEGRVVIGQLLDETSMATLARLSSLPTKKGIKGVLPGQNSGPPLLKVALDGVYVAEGSKKSEG